ncbi:hypothetical protein LTR96_009848 [Exophiala xenobiotica]|nr:hypothetical protein LTR96_009848 [Exophiala xenobiotica]
MAAVHPTYTLIIDVDSAEFDTLTTGLYQLAVGTRDDAKVYDLDPKIIDKVSHQYCRARLPAPVLAQITVTIDASTLSIRKYWISHVTPADKNPPDFQPIHIGQIYEVPADGGKGTVTDSAALAFEQAFGFKNPIEAAPIVWRSPPIPAGGTEPTGPPADLRKPPGPFWVPGVGRLFPRSSNNVDVWFQNTGDDTVDEITTGDQSTEGTVTFTDAKLTITLEYKNGIFTEKPATTPIP